MIGHRDHDVSRPEADDASSDTILELRLNGRWKLYFSFNTLEPFDPLSSFCQEVPTAIPPSVNHTTPGTFLYGVSGVLTLGPAPTRGLGGGGLLRRRLVLAADNTGAVRGSGSAGTAAAAFSHR